MIVPRTLVLWLALTGVPDFLGIAARAETISLQPVADTTLIEYAPGNNLGGGTFFNAGTTGVSTRNRALMFFDLSEAIPAGSIITSAELSLSVVAQPRSGQQNSSFGLRRMLQSWGEGAQVSGDQGLGRGSPADQGEATWNSRFAGGAMWAQPGGQAGVDFSSLASASAFVGGTGNEIVFGSNPALMADLQLWLDNPGENFGWMLATELEGVDKTARSFAARESGFGPVLTVNFTSVPEPGVMTLVGLFLLGAVAMRRRDRRQNFGAASAASASCNGGWLRCVRSLESWLSKLHKHETE